VIQLTRSGVVIDGSEEDFERLRLQYACQHYLILPNLVERELLDVVTCRVEAAPFRPFDHHGIALEQRMFDEDTLSILNFLVNMPEFLRTMEILLGIRRIGWFGGRVYRMTAVDGHYDSWHRDVGDRRLATLSLNLTRQTYGGGGLQMRCSDSDSILHEVHNIGFGDALVFRVSRKLAHRIMPIEGNVPKIAYAGWFRWGPGYHESLRNGEMADGARPHRSRVRPRSIPSSP
jgi:hypothetical protein